jgi:hypothetical protein
MSFPGGDSMTEAPHRPYESDKPVNLCMFVKVVVFAAASLSWAAAAEPQIDSVAGTGEPTNNGKVGSANELNVGDPFGVDVGPHGALYITEVRNHRVWRLDTGSGHLEVVAGNGRKGYRGDGGVATTAELNEPYEVRFDVDGNMFFIEMQNHIVRRVDVKTNVITTVAGNGQQGYGGDGGPAREARLNQPHSIALDGQRGLYIADIGNHRIRRVDLATGTIESIAGATERRLPVDGQAVRGTPVLGPRALYVDGRTMWVALREGHSVWRFDLDNPVWRHVAGTGSKGYRGDGGPASTSTFNGPKGIAIGPQGNVYVVDTENHAIRKIDVGSGSIQTVAGGRHGSGGDGGPAVDAGMDRPHGICVSEDGTIFVGDTLNHRVRRIRQ